MKLNKWEDWGDTTLAHISFGRFTVKLYEGKEVDSIAIEKDGIEVHFEKEVKDGKHRQATQPCG